MLIGKNFQSIPNEIHQVIAIIVIFRIIHKGVPHENIFFPRPPRKPPRPPQEPSETPQEPPGTPKKPQEPP